MGRTLEEISRDAVGLPRSQRLALARFFLQLDDPSEDPVVEALWHSEILRRAHAVEKGTAQAVPYEDVMKRVDAALRR
jgi:hypothetical protein